MANTTIRISKENREKLEALKIDRHQTADEIISALFRTLANMPEIMAVSEVGET